MDGQYEYNSGKVTPRSLHSESCSRVAVFPSVICFIWCDLVLFNSLPQETGENI